MLPKIVLGLNLFLAVMCVTQWVRETRLHGSIVKLETDGHAKSQSIQKLESTVKKWEGEIARLDRQVEDLKGLDKTNKTEIAALSRDLRKTENAKTGLERQVEAYKEAVERQNENLKQQNESIARQNEIINEQSEGLKRLVTEREELAGKVNERTQQYNEVVQKFNDFIAQVDAAQGKDKKAN